MAGRALLFGGAAAVALSGAIAFAALRSAQQPAPSDRSAPLATASDESAAAPRPLQLYCQFYVFTEQRPRLAFLFEVEARENTARFAQLYIAESDGARTDYDGQSEPRPEWRYDAATEPRTISSTIKVPDASQAGMHDEHIQIELYDYKTERDAKAFFEAGLKNVHYQNLPGKCRQSRG